MIKQVMCNKPHSFPGNLLWILIGKIVGICGVQEEVIMEKPICTIY